MGVVDLYTSSGKIHIVLAELCLYPSTRIQILFSDAVVYRHAKQVGVAPACYRNVVLDVWKIPCSMHYLVLNHATYFL